MNAKETLEIISKQWCTTEDLQLLSQLGVNNVCKLKKKIKDELEEQGYLLPKGKLPMNEVVKYLKIDIEYLNKVKDLNN